MRPILLALVTGAIACGSTSPAANLSTPDVAAGSGRESLAGPADPLLAKSVVVKTTYHGVTVADPYQWLEADTPDVKAWSDAHNRVARAALDAVPGRAELAAEYQAMLNAPVTHYSNVIGAGGRFFALRKRPDHEHPELIVMADLEKPEAAQLVIDPTAGTAGRAIDFYVPSPDGKRVAVSMSMHGSEVGQLHLIGVDGKDLEPPLADVYRGTGLGDATWAPDSKTVYYTRYPRAGEEHADEPQLWLSLWRHQLGADVAADVRELGPELPKTAEIQLTSDNRGRVLASVQMGDGGQFRHYLRSKAGAWTQLDDWNDDIPYIGFGTTSDLWVVSRKDAPRGKIMRLVDTATSAAKATVVVPEGPDALVTSYTSELGVVDTGDRIAAIYQLGGPSTLRMYARSGKALPALPLPSPIAITGFVALPDGLLAVTSSYLGPYSRWRYTTGKRGQPGTFAPLSQLSPPSVVDLSGFEVIRETATSKDGTQVPYTIVWPKGAAKDGTRPCIATGYGGYGFNTEPSQPLGFVPLLRRGICFIDTNLRGGGEFGEAWHRAGMLTAKQNVFDDFASVLAAVAERKYTAVDRLGIYGGSNGGLLIGATITQHPELVKAALADVAILDMLRVEVTPNGAFNVPELGTVTDQAQFTALHSYSPYHRALAGIPKRSAFPATLFTTGANDPRVAPWHSRKMVAAMRAAQSAGSPVLLATTEDAGHGIGAGTSELVAKLTDLAAFFVWQLPAAR